MPQHSETPENTMQTPMNDSALGKQLLRLEQALADVEGKGLEGDQFAQRTRGDLQRLMSSAWQNCVDLSQRFDREQQGIVPAAVGAAMKYAVTLEDGLKFLEHWQLGEWSVIRDRWPDAPEMIYVSKELILY